MSQLVAPTHTLVDSIPLGRRILEIMQEKGAAYTIAAMSKRLGINRETFRLMLKGKREIYTFELEKIAQDFKLSVERILQADTVEVYKQMEELHLSRADNQLAWELAQAYSRCSIGITERCMALNMIGNSYYGLNKYILSDDIYQQALVDSKLILRDYGDSRLFLYITLNLVNSKTTQKKYEGVRRLIADVEPYIELDDNPRVPAIHYYLDANVKEEWEGDMEGARESLYKSNYYYQEIGHPFSLAKSQHRVAVFEYRQKNYEKSYELFQITWPAFQELKDYYHYVVNGRDFAKLLIRMNKMPLAREVITNRLDTIHANPDIDWRHLEGDLNLLAAIAEQNPIFAEKIVDNKLGSISIQKLARKFVIEHYERIGDEASKTAFEKRIGKLRTSPIDMLLAAHKLSLDSLMLLIDFVQLHSWHTIDL